MLRLVPMLAVALATALASSSQAQEPGVELAIRRFAPSLDGDVADWPKAMTPMVFGRANIFEGASSWQGDKDASGSFLVSCDNNHLYVAGRIVDDQFAGSDPGLPGGGDCVELHIGGEQPREPGGRAADRAVLRLYPQQPRRPWSWGASLRATTDDQVQAATQLAGIVVTSRQVEPTVFEFEAALPFHHFPGLRSGAELLSFDLVLRDHDLGGAPPTSMSWSAADPAAGVQGARLRVPPPGVLVPLADEEPLLSSELFVDLPYLLVPLSSLLVLVLLLRGWTRIRGRMPWLRPVLVVTGIATFLVGLWLPSLLSTWRAQDQQRQLEARFQGLRDLFGRFDPGTLTSYRGAIRDRAVIDLIEGRSIARQRYTSYRSLVDIAPDQFGPPLRYFDDLPVRCYWLPLPTKGAPSFQFDAPLQGKRLHLVLARPFEPAFTLAAPTVRPPRLTIELDSGPAPQTRFVDLDFPFADGVSLGRDFWEACVVPIDLDRELRALSVSCDGNPDLRLVGISLEGLEPGRIAPLSLGAPSRDGVLTDLRGPYPQDAGIDLGSGATMTVAIPEQQESPQRLWFFYRAVYPGGPTVNPGARVAEIVLHFADGRQKQTHVLEHQHSMFYELAVHNTRDEPPEGSAASVALTWVDESLERHVNLGYPVLDLPTDTSLQAIEFKNLAEYSIRFRSVVFVNERAIAPQDPPDSPLVREGNDCRLKPGPLAELEGLVVSIYRGGRLSASTLAADARQDVQTLPRAVGTSETEVDSSLLANGGRRLSLFAPLRGDNWDGAVLTVSSTDAAWTEADQAANRLGLLLCLLSTPFLLVLLSELLAVVANLRFRLMTVLSVASLAPLGLLSLVLVQVLETGHSSDVEEGVRATVRSAMAQLEDQKGRVQTSAQQWLRDLTTLANEKLGDAEPAAAVPSVAEELQKLLTGQLPPDWRGGFLRLEWRPSGSGATDAVVRFAGDERMVQAEVPVRLDPGLFMQWGRLMLGVRVEQSGRAGTFALAAGRQLDGSLLGALAPGYDLLLTDVRGYPLAASEGRESARRLLAQAYDPPTMADRERALAMGDEQRRPVVSRAASPIGRFVLGTDVMRDLQDTPRGLLVLALPDERASLELPIGRVPVRAFFLLLAGSLVVLAAFLSFVVSGRISRPIEQLERGAQALSRGSLETRVPNDEGGQVGRLTRAFNQMAADLQARLQDLQALNRTMADLAAEHEEGTAIEVLRRFCTGHTAADAVVTLMLDASGTGLVLHAGGEPIGDRIGLSGLSFASLVGSFCCRARHGRLPAPWGEALPQCRSMVGLPIVFGGQTRGVVLLGFGLDEPSPVELELLDTVVAQAASACERSRLQRLAVQDPVTGTFNADYFRRRVVDEVSLAQHSDRPLSLLAFQVAERHRSAAGLQLFTAQLRAAAPPGAMLGYAGGGCFHVALAGCDRSRAEALRQEVVGDWRAEVRRAGGDEGGARLASAVVQFPAEAPSAEFLFDAAAGQLAVDPERDAVEAESDASLLRAGVTAISRSMRRVYSTLRRVAPTDLPVLLEGETGVGKEVLTNLVHRWSRRAAGPLVKVHCASLSETLLASELFGHERGAFTGADRRKIGRFEQAHGGTLFLDEVGDIPLDVQVKLLRALQEGEIDRVGGTESVKVDVRVIAATNRDMTRMVADGRFREDLYYRLQGLVVRVPPLRERKEEVGALVDRFRREVVAEGHAPDRSFSTGAMDELYRQNWPGNIRQLRTTVFRALVLARGAVVQDVDVRAALAGGSGVLSQLPAAAAMAVVESAAEVRGGGEAGAGGARPTGEAPVGAPPASPALTGEAPSGGSAVEGAAEPLAAAAPDPAFSGAMEPTVPLPRPSPDALDADPGLGDGQLPDRLAELFDRVSARGRYTTQDHMSECGLSHRTALRDLQALVARGLIERVGARRGAFYRPSRSLADSPED